VPAGAAPVAPKPTITTVASGFDNPRGLAFGKDDKLYVAEAGTGGPKCVEGGEAGPICPGLTGAVSVITHGGEHHRIVSGLASFADHGFFATGPDGLSSNDDGGLSTIIASCRQQVGEFTSGAGFDPALVSALQAQAGRVLTVRNGGFRTNGDVGGVDWEWSLTHKNLVPGQFPDCNPYGVLSTDDGHWVVDAATNTLDRVDDDGHASIVAFFPNPPASDAVPTCVAKGPDGALYVSELTGGGNPPGSARVWRVDPDDEHPTPTVWATGLTAVTGCGFSDGDFYATEFSTLGLENAAPGTGALVRVPPHSSKPIVIVDTLSFPNGFAADDGSIYVSNWSVAPAVVPAGGPPFKPGEVVRIHVGDQKHDHHDHGDHKQRDQDNDDHEHGDRHSNHDHENHDSDNN
jgi:sugar lactone lactonase YvrE